MNLHIPTMFVMILIASTIMAVSLFVIAARRLPDLRTWSLALAFQVAAYVLLSLRGQISDWLSILVANACITVSLSLYVAGLYRFHHQRFPPWLLWVPLGIITVGFALLLHDYRGRVLFGGTIWLVQSLHLYALVARYRQQTVGRGQYIIGFSALVFAASMVYRWVAMTTGLDTSVQFTDPTPLVVTTYIASLSSTLLLAVGALTMIQERYAQALGESEIRYRKLIDSATIGICVLQDAKLRFVNPRTLELLGYRESELIDRPFLEFVHPDDQMTARANHAKRIAGLGEGLTYAVRMQTRHQGWRWVEVSGVRFEWHGRASTLNFIVDITERRESEQQIRDLAYHDTLTHLPNRRLLMDHLKMARAAYHRNGKHGALVFIDLDNFKPLNDQHGHAVGDLLLIEVAQRLLHHIRGADTAARFGGDEFVVLLTQLSEQTDAAHRQAEQFAQKLLAVLAEPYVLSVEHDSQPQTVEHHCSATLGVVIFNGLGEPDDALLDRADAAMYQAKQAGRNCVRFHDEGSASAPQAVGDPVH
ncbi:MAG: diguanylate cyclase [Lysobacterales bacterium]